MAELSRSWICKGGGKVEIEKGKFAVVCSRSPQNFEFGHFTLLSCRERQRNVPKCKTHLQGIVLLIKTDCLVTFSLPSPSYLLKLSIKEYRTLYSEGKYHSTCFNRVKLLSGDISHKRPPPPNFCSDFGWSLDCILQKRQLIVSLLAVPFAIVGLLSTSVL